MRDPSLIEDGGGSESEDIKVEGKEIALDDVAASSSGFKKPLLYSEPLRFKKKKLKPALKKNSLCEEELDSLMENVADIEKKFSDINRWLEEKADQGCIRSTEGEGKTIKSFKCCVCSSEKIFRFASDLKKHLVYCHLMCKKGQSIGKKYQCPDCFKLYATWPNMNAHYREKHTPISCQHSCDTCGKRFNREDHLELHIQSHTKVKCCQCSTCGLKISTPTGLSRHYTKKHLSPLSDEFRRRSQKNICRFCEEKFKTIAQREEHIINCHGAQLDWAQEERSRKQRDVQAILSLETAEIEAYPLKKVLKELNKKYTCAECGVQYTCPENVKKHARALHQIVEKGDYTCNYCDQIFGFFYVKQRHMMEKHSTEFPWLQAKVSVVRNTVDNILKRSVREDRAENVPSSKKDGAEGVPPSVKDGAEGVPPSVKDGAEGVPSSKKIEQNHSLLDSTVKVWVEEFDLKTEPLNEDPEEYQRIYNENPIEVEETNINSEDDNTSFQPTSAFVSLELLPSKKRKKAKKKKVQDIPVEEEQSPQKQKKNKKKEKESWDTCDKSDTFVTPEKKKKKKKSKKPDMDQILSDIVQSEKKRKADNEDELSSKKKKKYGNHRDVDILEQGRVEDESEPQQILINNLLSSISESVSSPKKKKKKKKEKSRRQDVEKSDAEETSLKHCGEELSSSEVKKKKKKKETSLKHNGEELSSSEVKKKKKKKEASLKHNEEELSSGHVKKKKKEEKKHKKNED